MIPVNLFPNCFANLNLWISHHDKVSIHLLRLRYPSHNSWIVFALSVNGLIILWTNFWSLVVFSLYRSTKVIRSLSGILCKSAILNLVPGFRFQVSDFPAPCSLFLVLCLKVKNTFRLSFFNFVPLHSGQVLISSIAWKSTVKSPFAYWSFTISSIHL